MAQLPDHIPEILKPRLRLFMSVDVVGSTKLKQPEFLSKQIDWLDILQRFYGETVEAVQTEWLALRALFPDPATHPDFLGDPPQFWKTVGDEVLYYKDLTDSRQLALALECWKKALTRVRTFLYKQNEGALKDAVPEVKLDVKSAVWTAGFPWRNKTIVSPSGLLNELCKGDYAEVFQNAHEKAHREPAPGDGTGARVEFDFIGPGIDIGFRLCGFATVQKMVLSMDAAYILAAVRGANAFLLPEPLYYDGRIPLKGVFAGREYPLFWIDNSHPDSFEAKESRARHPISDTDVLRFCETFYKEFYNLFTHRPFIVGDHGGLTAIPDDFDRWMGVQVAQYEERRKEGERRQQAEQELTRAGASRGGGARQPAAIDVNELKQRLTRDIAPQAEDEPEAPKKT
ncbi:MAG TPA: hypothetical protein VFP12_10315 [Allosphingosinicella sp.]|nr:hypothetical protein [Allosphingosinicella sp.]